MPVEWEELRLVWPPELFRREAQALVYPRDEETAGWLLDEAFHGGRALQLWKERFIPPGLVRAGSVAASIAAAKRGEVLPALVLPQDALLQELADAADTLPRYERRRLYSERRSGASAGNQLTRADLGTAVARAVLDLDRVGYFDDSFGSPCPDADENPATEGNRQLRLAMGPRADGIWPIKAADIAAGGPAHWPDELLLDLIEVLHEHVSRPRRRQWHEYHFDFDFGDFSRSAGQAVYRWRLNALLDRSDLGLRLAENGPDVGSLVEVSNDAREELMVRVGSGADAGRPDEVGHAVELFRRRGASAADKRSALMTLYRVLEPHRTLLVDALPTDDERTLFGVVNEFGVRHSKANQRTEYDEVFLDFMFWTYLATVELLDKLLARTGGAGAGG